MLVAAPTGSGKTVVAEYAVERALGADAKAFYTTPLKALSNQKFGDFVARYGAARVGLLTGDNSINGEAPIVVMTTEVLRNMLYEGSDTLEGLRFVVMDEVHYLQDPYRGAVWEEVLIHLPLSVSVVCLSATVSNAEEFGEWIGTLRGPTRVVIEERRPVPLEHLYLTGGDLYPIHVERDGEPTANPELVRLERDEARRQRDLERGRYVRRPRRMRVPRREEVVEVLHRHEMLPAIYFVFSRAGCQRSVQWMLEAGIRLTSPEEEARIREFAEMRAAMIPDEDLDTLGFGDFQGDRRGAVPGRAGEGRVRHRDPVAGDQHAGAHRGDRGPLEVLRRAPRAAHPGRVHTAHRPGGPAGDRRARLCGGAAPAAGLVRDGCRARHSANVRADVVVPALIQHGRQPGAELLAGGGPPPVELVVRPVPDRPRRRRARASARAGAVGDGGVRGADGLRPRRLHGVLVTPGAGAAAARGRRPPRAARPGRRGGWGAAEAEARRRGVRAARPAPRPGRGALGA